MGVGTWQSPYIIDIPDNFGKSVTLTFTFNNATRALTGAQATREAGCQWNKIYVGLGGDGIPDHTSRVFDVSGFVGTRAFTPTQLSNIGLSTFEDVFQYQVTAGP